MDTEPGKCPKCGSENLNYGSVEIESESLMYPYDCEDCKFEGQEWYNIEFSTHFDTHENEITKQQIAYYLGD